MVGKPKDDPKSRLERLVKALRERKPIDQIAEAFGASEKLSKRAAWENDALHEAQMLKLQEIEPAFRTEIDGPVKRAFEAFGLSPGNPSDWQVLVTYFAHIHFGSATKPPGRPSKWTGERLCQLMFDFAVARNANPDFTNTKIFERMIKDKKHRDQYGSETTDALKDAYRKAKNPATNEVLARMQEAIQVTLWSTIRETINKTKIDLSDDEVRPLVPKLALDDALKLIESRWPSIKKALRN